MPNIVPGTLERMKKKGKRKRLFLVCRPDCEEWMIQIPHPAFGCLHCRLPARLPTLTTHTHQSFSPLTAPVILIFLVFSYLWAFAPVRCNWMISPCLSAKLGRAPHSCLCQIKNFSMAKKKYHEQSKRTNQGNIFTYSYPCTMKSSYKLVQKNNNSI